MLIRKMVELSGIERNASATARKHRHTIEYLAVFWCLGYIEMGPLAWQLMAELADVELFAGQARQAKEQHEPSGAYGQEDCNCEY